MKPVNKASWSPDGKRIIAALDDKTIVIWSDVDSLSSTDDPKLWTATTYCMPLEVRQRLLDFPEEQSRADLLRCQQKVREAQTKGASGLDPDVSVTATLAHRRLARA